MAACVRFTRDRTAASDRAPGADTPHLDDLLRIMLERGGAPAAGGQPTYSRPEPTSSPAPMRNSVPAEEEIRVEDIPF